MTNYPESRKANTVVQDLESEVLIYDFNINKAFCLNQTAALVYRSADGTKSVGEISSAMSTELNMPVSEDIVYLALNELRKNDLLENADEVPDHFGGLTRREAVKRAGLASMVTLPVIASVVAPSAVMAQSGLLPCVVNQCMPPGSILCASCAGRSIAYNVFTSMDGTCSGPAGTGGVVCTPGLSTFVDVRLTSVV